ncbi:MULTISPECIES: DUF3509 domain-containing protein [unclassified Pseudomonas]|uniref:DUF3509 domain-containing protein n=1 Tax=unclassified Pseudomonas TaxID=196821 RepID=UPI000BCB2781|nr:MULTISPECIES: DUF3509 domain-containing protein [unclassified Pseudomonas]PVZ16004.1 uncharacterized protein DUF3509 [Pseudomonas sp. URIL14HWK12:I12]PVZ26140.1 uncharacterized protein DUF3509 [Pseudomonas sp. URIL14HWK12:I10]PVZ36336.1 uncharacterized protein DUF3509 [Pseudomonas sp. URIL14HWK12:I11]SNZ18398.1 Protein of unknown function [Pseudomonas sp. URIL14HWK12:I9]
MDNPFKIITDAFQPEYRVNLSIQGLDGTIMLTLSNAQGVVAKRLISAQQRNDPKRLARLIDSVRFGIAIEQGSSAVELLTAMTERDRTMRPRPQWLGEQPSLAVGI